jgi:MFS family permease
MHLFGHFTNGTFEPQTAGLLLAVMAGFMLAGKPILGWLADRVGAKLAIDSGSNYLLGCWGRLVLVRR